MSTNNTLVWVIAGGAAAAFIYYLHSSQATPTALSIYPSLAWTATTSMASTPAQKATTAVIPPTGQFASVQQAAQSAVLSECAGSLICSSLAADTQLGF